MEAKLEEILKELKSINENLEMVQILQLAPYYRKIQKNIEVLKSLKEIKKEMSFDISKETKEKRGKNE